MANKIKIARYESIILENINKTIIFEVNDTIAKKGRATYVKLTNDLSIARVYVDSINRTETMSIVGSLNKISGLFRSKISQSIDSYKIPKIIFEIDKSIDYANNIDKIIKDIKNKENNEK